MRQYHPYHLVTPSPWPYLGAFSALMLTSGTAMYLHGYQYGNIILWLGLLLTLTTMVLWWRDVIRESTYEGHHTIKVQTGLIYGMLLFIFSEVCFFFAWFWGFFDASLAPTVEIGGIWPPQGITALNPWSVPLLNTVVLVTSGATVTWAHHSLIYGNRRYLIIGLLLTIILGLLFTLLQAMEYNEAPFTIADSVYGSTFYMATGFHGLHVIIGTLFLTICLMRIIRWQMTREHHLGFITSAWYWHFVDVVWLFLFLSIYWWGS